MPQFLSVIICTHNAREDYLTRVLAALQRQTLGKENWELLLVDNCSVKPPRNIWDLAWHPSARHIEEAELGLAAARQRGIQESIGGLLVFVDDDNVLAHDYLEIALKTAGQHPNIGAFCGSIKGNFEMAPPEWTKAYQGGMAILEIDRDYWWNLYSRGEALPCGAGLCIRHEVAQHYCRKVLENPLRRKLGRTGSGLGASEDVDLAWCAIDMGLGNGRFHQLKLTHLIPQHRLTEQYIVGLIAGIEASNLIVDSLRPETRTPEIKPRTRDHIKFLYKLFRCSPIQRKVLLASRRECKKAREIISRNTASTVSDRSAPYASVS